MTNTIFFTFLIYFIGFTGCKKGSNPTDMLPDTQTHPDLTMVSVAGGTFQMGSEDTIDQSASPPHSVTVASYYIDKYEITYDKWTTVATWGAAHGYSDLYAGTNGYHPVGASNPITTVSWHDVVKWCNARSERDGLTPVYYTSSSYRPENIYKTGIVDLQNSMVNWVANGYRLPTEAEWEFAAKGGTHAKAPTPYIYSGSDPIDGVAWYKTNSGNATHTVGEKAANELGIYDMSGNVWEWCWDWYDPYTSISQTDPKGPGSGRYRILRGGSFDNLDYVSRCARRNYISPHSAFENLGFRCVQN